ncbi:MAG: sensor histidine kinase [Sciscionella sp.]|nr:sensor histidine kinase [Sciscionella sp.]
MQYVSSVDPAPDAVTGHAPETTTTTTETTTKRAEHAWHRGTFGWHIGFAIFVVLCAVLMVGDDGTSAGRKALMFALLGVLCAWYALTGARALHGGRNRRGLAYIAVALPLTVIMFGLSPAGGIMLCALYPHIWSMLTQRLAVIATVLSTLGVSVSMWVNQPDGGLTGALIFAGVGMAFALVLGLWIDSIIEQSKRRAALIAELAETRAELAEANHTAGVLAERERLARDLHDTLAQDCTSVLLLLRAARGALDRHANDRGADDRGADECRRHLDLAEITTRNGLAEIRSLVGALTSSRLDGVTLPAALGRLVEQLGVELGITARLTVCGEYRELPADREVSLLRVTQEALANVRKHAHAGAVVVELAYHDDEVRLRIADDGRGFDMAQQSAGFGLRGLRARMLDAGGEFDVRTAPGAGTAVEVCLPNGVAP